jgi:hypothetical protein
MGVLTSRCEGIPLLQYVMDYSSKTLVKSTQYSNFALEGELVILHTECVSEFRGWGQSIKMLRNDVVGSPSSCGTVFAP